HDADDLGVAGEVRGCEVRGHGCGRQRRVQRLTSRGPDLSTAVLAGERALPKPPPLSPRVGAASSTAGSSGRGGQGPTGSRFPMPQACGAGAACGGTVTDLPVTAVRGIPRVRPCGTPAVTANPPGYPEGLCFAPLVANGTVGQPPPRPGRASASPWRPAA